MVVHARMKRLSGVAASLAPPPPLLSSANSGHPQPPPQTLLLHGPSLTFLPALHFHALLVLFPPTREEHGFINRPSTRPWRASAGHLSLSSANRRTIFSRSNRRASLSTIVWACPPPSAPPPPPPRLTPHPPRLVDRRPSTHSRIQTRS